MRQHLRIEHLEASLIRDSHGAAPLLLAVRSLSFELSHDGLVEIVSALLPQEPLQVSIVDRPGTGCNIRVQAARFGFTPRITVSLALADNLPGAILINVDPGSRWSLLDRVMLGIAEHNLAKVARSQPGISRLPRGGYQLDLQGVIRDQLLDNNAPIRWDGRLERIDGSQERIRVEFVSVIANEES